MTYSEIKAKGLFKIRVELEGAYRIDADKDPMMVQARADLEKERALLSALETAPATALLDARAPECRQRFEALGALLARRLEQIEHSNVELADMADVFKGLWISFREPRQEELLSYDGSGKTEPRTISAELMEECAIDWNLPGDKGEKATKGELLEILKQSCTLYAHVLSEWGRHLPLALKSGRV